MAKFNVTLNGVVLARCNSQKMAGAVFDDLQGYLEHGASGAKTTLAIPVPTMQAVADTYGCDKGSHAAMFDAVRARLDEQVKQVQPGAVLQMSAAGTDATPVRRTCWAIEHRHNGMGFGWVHWSNGAQRPRLTPHVSAKWHALGSMIDDAVLRSAVALVAELAPGGGAWRYQGVDTDNPMATEAVDALHAMHSVANDLRRAAEHLQERTERLLANVREGQRVNSLGEVGRPAMDVDRACVLLCAAEERVERALSVLQDMADAKGVA